MFRQKETSESSDAHSSSSPRAAAVEAVEPHLLSASCAFLAELLLNKASQNEQRSLAAKPRRSRWCRTRLLLLENFRPLQHWSQQRRDCDCSWRLFGGALSLLPNVPCLDSVGRVGLSSRALENNEAEEEEKPEETRSGWIVAVRASTWSLSWAILTALGVVPGGLGTVVSDRQNWLRGIIEVHHDSFTWSSP